MATRSRASPHSPTSNSYYATSTGRVLEAQLAKEDELPRTCWRLSPTSAPTLRCFTSAQHTRRLRKRLYERFILSSFLTDISRAWQRTPRTMKRLARPRTPGALGPSHHRDLSTDLLLHLLPRRLTTSNRFLCTRSQHGPQILHWLECLHIRYVGNNPRSARLCDRGM